MTYARRQAVRATGVLAAAGVLAIGLAAGRASRALAGDGAAASPAAGFRSLGQMPGSALGTDVSGISGDGSTIAGYGWICTTFNPNGSCLTAGDVQAFRWTPAGGYQTLGTPGTSAFFGSGPASSDGSVIVGGAIKGANGAAAGVIRIGGLPCSSIIAPGLRGVRSCWLWSAGPPG